MVSIFQRNFFDFFSFVVWQGVESNVGLLLDRSAD